MLPQAWHDFKHRRHSGKSHHLSNALVRSKRSRVQDVARTELTRLFVTVNEYLSKNGLTYRLVMQHSIFISYTTHPPLHACHRCAGAPALPPSRSQICSTSKELPILIIASKSSPSSIISFLPTLLFAEKYTGVKNVTCNAIKYLTPQGLGHLAMVGR